MASKLIIFVSLLFLGNSITAQTKEDIQILKQKILLADSVILISHDVAWEYAPKPVPDWDKNDTSMNLKKWRDKHPSALKFIQNGKINRKIINESIVLTDSGKSALIKIIVRPVLRKDLRSANCDEPRHTIIIYIKSKESFVDICFSCRHIHTSKDIPFWEGYMDNRKWNELESLFKMNGITMPVDKYEFEE